MSKFDKILRLVDLLSHREWVTLDTIMSTCEIPRRTAFRYLTSISEADIPVFYDRERKAYSLSIDHNRPTAAFDLGDTIVLTLALHLLSKHVNDSYRKDIDELTKRLLVRQPFPLEDVLQTFEDRIRTEPANVDHSSLLSAVLLQAAVRSEKGVQLRVGGEANEGRQVEMDRPRMLFRRTWQVVDAADAEDDVPVTAAPLSDVTNVTIH